MKNCEHKIVFTCITAPGKYVSGHDYFDANCICGNLVAFVFYDKNVKLYGCEILTEDLLGAFLDGFHAQRGPKIDIIKAMKQQLSSLGYRFISEDEMDKYRILL